MDYWSNTIKAQRFVTRAIESREAFAKGVLWRAHPG